MTSLTIFIDGERYSSKRELHLALKMMLDLPEHYGCNADALYDCLSERTGKPVRTWAATRKSCNTIGGLAMCRPAFLCPASGKLLQALVNTCVASCVLIPADQQHDQPDGDRGSPLGGSG